jgi:hypothetical protein
MAFNGFTIDHVTLAALDPFEANCVALRTCSRKVEPLFGQAGAKRGDAIRIRKPAQFTVRTGQSWTGQNVNEQFDTLTLNYQIGIDFEMSSMERKLDLNSLTEQCLKPAAIRLANEVDRIVLRDVALRTYHNVGTYGTTPSSTATYYDAGARLSDMTAPRGKGQRHLNINPEMEGDIIQAITPAQFNPSGKIGAMFTDADLDGTYQNGMNWHMDQNLYRHTNGARAGTILVNGATADGATTLVTDGWTGSGAVAEGDRFTIADVFAVNPITKATYPFLQPFVVTAAGTNAAGALTINISPTIRSTGAFQNVSALPADNAALTFSGAASALATIGLLWHKEAVALAIVPLEKPDGVNQASMKYDSLSGVGMRYCEWWDGDTDQWKSRFDIVFGVLAQRTEHIVAVLAA